MLDNFTTEKLILQKDIFRILYIFRIFSSQVCTKVGADEINKIAIQRQLYISITKILTIDESLI